MKLSEHFTLEEFTFSAAAARAGLDNRLPEILSPAAIATCEGLERIRALTGHPIRILSGYRAPKVNAAVGGSEKSQHMRAEAADIICPGVGQPAELAKLIESRHAEIGFDQLIMEFGGWVHVSFAKFPRCSVLTIRSRSEGYLRGIVT